MGKMFLPLIDTYFSPANNLHRIFNRNTVRVSYSCTQNISQNTKGQNKNVTQIRQNHQLECNCGIKTECALNRNCWKEDMIYECTTLTTF